MSEPTRRHAVVTGGSSGIGLASAAALISAGHNVTISGRDPTRLRRAVDSLSHLAPGTAHGVVADVRSQQDVDALIAQVCSGAGLIDTVVCSAGRGGGGASAQISDELWNDVIDTNLTGTFRVVRAALANGGILDAPRGRIICIASTGGKQGVRHAMPYSASKHGVVGLCKALGLELAHTSVTVNAVCPGFVETPMAQTVREGYAGVYGVTVEEARAMVESRVPIGRYVRADEVAAMVRYLADPGADAVTAQALNVCGGLGNY